MKAVAIFLLGVTFAYAGWSNLASVPKLANTGDRARGISDIWWLKVKSALKPLVPPAAIAKLDANIPDGFIVYPFQYPHYRKPQLRRRVFAMPPLLEDNVQTLPAVLPANIVENSQIRPAPRNTQQLLKTYQISDPSLADYEHAGVAILHQNSLNNDSIQPSNLAYQESYNDDSSSHDQRDQNNHKLARLRQVRLDEVDKNLAEPVDGEQQAELETKDRPHVSADKSDALVDYYIYSVVEE